MNKTLRISFSLKNTYRVNGILYSLKQIPLVKKLLPQKLYGVRGLKIFANILSGLWELVSVFLGKLLYLTLMVAGMAMLYDGLPREAVFLHILLFLSVIGAFMNTFLFNPTKDKYYAMILLRMNARDYTLVNYGYSLAKLIVGFLPFAIWFGFRCGVSLWTCLLIPFFVTGLKLLMAAWTLRDYEKTKRATNENKLGKFLWITVFVLLAAAYGLPAAKIVIPAPAVQTVMALGFLAGLPCILKVLHFSHYPEMYRELLAQSMNDMDQAKAVIQNQSKQSISADTGITSRRRGFEYLNELFIKRHQKVLWKSTKRQAAVCAILTCGVLLAFYLAPEFKSHTNELLMSFLPYFVFIMYAINRGTGFTRVLFMNCDHSLLTYSFYKQPDMVLKLFRIRLREIVKVNLLPALVLGCGLAVILWASGGTDNPFDYLVVVVSIACMSVFFSVHYLTIYYLLQPYNAGTEMKSGMYQIILSVTYVVCFCMMQVRMDIMIFGVLCIAFCVIYSVIACILVYRFAPKTFRLRQ